MYAWNNTVYSDSAVAGVNAPLIVLSTAARLGSKK
jgi:hypothetical protein